MSQRKVSIENYLCKTDTSIRRTLLRVPRGVHFKRFHCILLDVANAYLKHEYLPLGSSLGLKSRYTEVENVSDFIIQLKLLHA